MKNLLDDILRDEEGALTELIFNKLSLSLMALIMAAGFFTVANGNDGLQQTLMDVIRYHSGNFGEDVGNTGSFSVRGTRTGEVRGSALCGCDMLSSNLGDDGTLCPNNDRDGTPQCRRVRVEQRAWIGASAVGVPSFFKKRK